MRFLTMMLICFTSVWMPIQAQGGDDSLCESLATTDLLECASDRFASADEKLNSTYQEIIQLPESRASEFREVQRSWIRFRDSHCDKIHDESEGGSEANIERIFCLAALTEDRTRELESAGSASDSSFFRAVRSLERAGYDRQELLDRLASTPNDDLWSDYTDKHCRHIGNIVGSDVITCKARVNLERSY